jgi:hypothetical protein
MKQTSRELLVTTKAARHWEDNFEQQVEELISVINKVDTDEHVILASETLDVYRTTSKRAKKARKKKTDMESRPFEFLVFRN